MFSYKFHVLNVNRPILIMAIPKKVSRRKKLDCLSRCAEGEKQKDVAYEMGVSSATIKRAKRKLRLYGDIEGGKGKRGPKPIVTIEVLMFSAFLIVRYSLP